MKPTRVLFICHGNICRSPMAEFILKAEAKKAGAGDKLEISSAATSTEEIGNDMYPPAKRKLTEKGIPFTRRAARQIRKSDYDYYDMIIAMDEYNERNLKRYYDGDPDGKISLLLERPIADPWYTDDFETAYCDIAEGCRNLLKKLTF